MALYHTGSSATVTLLPLFILVCFTASGTSRELQQEAVESNSATAMTQVPQQEAVESNTELLLTGFCCYDGKSQSLVFRKARRSQCCATRVFDLTSECAVTEHMVVRPTLDACVCLPGYVLTSAGKCVDEATAATMAAAQAEQMAQQTSAGVVTTASTTGYWTFSTYYATPNKCSYYCSSYCKSYALWFGIAPGPTCAQRLVSSGCGGGVVCTCKTCLYRRFTWLPCWSDYLCP